MPLSNAEKQRRWRERHPGLHTIRVAESRKRHWDDYLARERKRQPTRYRRIQDEAGCHTRVRDFYPGFRLLKALETAEVIEI